jgi:hypothetical protein
LVDCIRAPFDSAWLGACNRVIPGQRRRREPGILPAQDHLWIPDSQLARAGTTVDNFGYSEIKVKLDFG